MAKICLTHSLQRGARHHPDRIMLVCGGRRRTYAQVAERVARLAAGLRHLGVQRGDRVGILAANSDRFVEYVFAIWWAGAVVNPINTRWSAKEIAFSLEDCGTHVAAVDDAFAPLAAEVNRDGDTLRSLIHVTDGEPGAGMLGYEQLIAAHGPMSDTDTGGDVLAGVFYTGGTTGFPKGVMNSHQFLWAYAQSALAEGIAGQGDVGLTVAPLYHLAGLASALITLIHGGTVVLLPEFNAERVLETLHAENVSFLLLVPTMIQTLTTHGRIGDFCFDRLRNIVYGASPISETLLGRALACFPAAQFTQAYGQSEIAIVTALTNRWHRDEGRAAGKLRSAGRPAVGVEVRILHPDGSEAARGSVGEIVARGPAMMQGYWNRPEETARSLRDGWIHTGDAGYMDAEGFLFVVDRVKDMIVSGGENVYSAEVENAIAQHPAVALCAVIGIPHPTWGESVHAVVVRKPGYEVTSAEDLIAHCHTLIAGYKRPRSVEFRDTLPLSGPGKILKSELRKPYWANQERCVA